MDRSFAKRRIAAVSMSARAGFICSVKTAPNI